MDFKWNSPVQCTLFQMFLSCFFFFFFNYINTVFHYSSSVIDGQFRRYMGPRTENDIITFIEDRKFQEVETVSSWRAPDSIA